ncbi:MAG: hypothetical protein ACD_12C00890G0001 [uncultured bacterium]|nr:MAG: hypothetical protein ACD_12C00890G0001 [uncultured bacterium]
MENKAVVEKPSITRKILKKAFQIAYPGLLILSQMSSSVLAKVGCQGFFDVANIDYTAAVWDPKDKAYESIFKQKSAPNETGFVQDVEYGGDLYEQGKADPLISFPIGARVVGYAGDTKETIIKLPDGTQLTSYTTCYSQK